MPGRWGIRIAALCFIAISAYICADALEYPVGGGTFPLFAAGSAIVLCLGMLVTSFRGPTTAIRDALLRSGRAGAWLARSFRGKAEERDIVFDFSYSRLKPLLTCIAAIVYVLAILEFGYFSATILFLIVAPIIVGVRSPFAIGMTLVILLPAMYAFFVLFLQANLPKGILF